MCVYIYFINVFTSTDLWLCNMAIRFQKYYTIDTIRKEKSGLQTKISVWYYVMDNK